MNYTLCVLGLANVIGAGLSYVVHGGTIAHIHALVETFLR
jgi:hypothetical protein